MENNDKKISVKSFSQQGGITAHEVHIEQAIIGTTNTERSGIADNRKVINPELEKVKKEFFSEKNKIRNYLFKELAKARNENLILEIRHITDAAEEDLGFKHDDTVAELEKLEEEGVIRFIKIEGEINTPYTRIRLTEKYFASIG